MNKKILDLNRLIYPSHVENLENLYGHKKKISENNNNYEYESLEKHIELANNYFIKILKKKKISNFFDEIIKKIDLNLSQNALDEFKLIYMNVINFHDIGKINPGFQKKLDKICNYGDSVSTIEDDKHSMLSATTYLNFFIRRVEVENEVGNISKSEMRLLQDLILLGAFAISRHHSDIVNFDSFLVIIAELTLPTYDNLSSFLNTSGIAGNFADLSMSYDCQMNKIEKDSPIYIEKREVWDKKCKCKTNKLMSNLNKNLENWRTGHFNKESHYHMIKHVYFKMIYSLLLAADYYSTNEFMNDLQTNSFGELENFDHIFSEYSNTEILKSIRKYEKEEWGSVDLSEADNINTLRNDMFLNAEKSLLNNMDKGMFFLEAPTGAGKSNMAINLSMQLIDKNENLGRIYYTYPFNTLIEQNKQTLYDTFAGKDDILDQIAVVNGVTPYKKKLGEISDKEEYNIMYMDRIFMNYPIILNSHVNLFNILFGFRKDSAFSFFQLYGSVIVLDEIQSYKFSIWTEMMRCFELLTEVMNIKFIFMSATLPDFSLIMKNKNICRLIEDSKIYFSNKLFKNRVQVNYDLMEYDSNEIFGKLIEKIEQHVKDNSRIMVEFINKNDANDFYNNLIEVDLQAEIFLMTGDDSILERNRIIKKIKDRGGFDHIVLIATQVVEAGVDIDMDIGFKDISKLDSEEQFMGRINRSCKRSGLVYFFDKYRARSIYKHDERLTTELTLLEDKSRNILLEKNFTQYYEDVLNRLDKFINKANNVNGLENFYNLIESLQFKNIAEKMKLIDEDKNKFALFFARDIEMEAGELFHGSLLGDIVWERYVYLLKNNEMSYPKKKVLLAEVRSYMDNFIFEVKYPDIPYNDIIGKRESGNSIMYIEDGNKYVKNGKLQMNAVSNDEVVFI